MYLFLSTKCSDFGHDWQPMLILLGHTQCPDIEKCRDKEHFGSLDTESSTDCKSPSEHQSTKIVYNS